MQDLRAVLDGAGRVADPQVRAFPEQVDLALADGFLDIQIAEHAGTTSIAAIPPSGPAKRSFP